MRPFYRNPVFWIGVALAGGAIAYAWIGDPVTQAQFFAAISPPPLGADGRCTGFPNGLGRWQWGHCCVGHDNGETDGWLLDCIARAIPTAAVPLAGLGVSVMMLCRPIYNQLQRWGWVR